MAPRLGLVPLAMLALAGCVLGPAPTPGPSQTASAVVSPGATPTAAATVPPSPTAAPTPEPTAAPSLAELVGQKLMIALDGPTADAALLERIRRGEIGGVILFGRNVQDEAQVTALVAALQGAAAEGGRPPLLVSVDQEGGGIVRLPWAPPTRTPPAMGRLGSNDEAFHQGAITGTALRADGVNLDLAPVADVPASTSSFLYRQGRWWSFDAGRTARLSDAFASGLLAGGVIPTMKHFPGLGLATRTTDRYVVTIDAPLSVLEPSLAPYRTAIGHGIPAIMLSNAIYPAFDPDHAAGWSPAVCRFLREDLGFAGVTMTDSLNGIGAAMGADPTELAILAAIAGTDVVLLTGGEVSTGRTFARMLAAAESGRIPRANLEASYARIVALKSVLGG